MSLTKKFTVIWVLLFFIILSTQAYAQKNYYPSTSQFETCAISTGQGLLRDFDCDNVPDSEDNCPRVANRNQRDTNRNGVGDACDPEQEQEQRQAQQNQQAQEPSADTARVEVVEIQDILIGGPGAVYTIHLFNNGETSREFQISVSGVEFGTYRISPPSPITVRAGESQRAYVHATAGENAIEGHHEFDLTITSGDFESRRTMLANVFSPGSVDTGISQTLIVVLIIIVILAVIAAIIYRERKGDEKKGGIHSYY